MKTTHTPGPWIADGKIVSLPTGGSVATCPWTTADSWTHDVTEQQAEANARLIAAAPDLLAACALALALVKDTWIEDHGNPQVGDLWKALHEGIAKATGQQS